jgi:hypothetical protein
MGHQPTGSTRAFLVCFFWRKRTLTGSRPGVPRAIKAPAPTPPGTRLDRRVSATPPWGRLAASVLSYARCSWSLSASTLRRSSATAACPTGTCMVGLLGTVLLDSHHSAQG